MKQIVPILKNEDGTAAMIAMLILVVVTLIGIAAINNSTIETRISGNERAHVRSFFNAEGAYPAAIPVVDDIRTGEDPAGFPATYAASLSFAGGGNDFWDELFNDADDVTDATPDITVPGLANAGVDIDKMNSELAGESIINRAGYDGLGSGLSANWVVWYRITAQGNSGDAVSAVEVGVAAVR